MVNVAGLTDFFSQSYNFGLASYDGYEQGFLSGNLDILLQRTRRSKTISESKIWDYVRVENDPNFGRASNSDKFEKLISRLSTTSAILTVVTSQIHMAGVHEFIPVNIKNLLFNLTSIIDTNINLLGNFEKQIVFSQIEQALFKDLEVQFLGGTITFNELVNFVDAIFEGDPFQENIENNGIRPLLALGIQNLLPESMTEVFNTLQYIDLLETIFINDEANQILFTSELESSITAYSDSKINTLITASDYEDVIIDFSDPLGLILQSKFKTDLNNSYQNKILVSVFTIGESYGLSVNQMNDISQVLEDDSSSNIDSAFSGTVGLPSLIQVSTGLSNQSSNLTLAAINNAFDTLANNIIKDAGLVAASSRPLDYLINVKTNIKKRIEFKRYGATTEQFVEIEDYLSSVVQGGKITDDILNDLDERLDEILKERNTAY